MLDVGWNSFVRQILDARFVALETALQLKPYRSLYVSFDQFPGTKGAATHIEHASRALFEGFGEAGLLFTLGDEEAPVFESPTPLFRPPIRPHDCLRGLPPKANS